MGEAPICFTARYIFDDEEEMQEGCPEQLNAFDANELAALEATAGVSVRDAEASYS